MMSYIPDFQKRRQQDSYGADIMQNSSYIVIILTVFLVLNMFTQHNYCAVNIYVLDIWQFVMCRWWFLVCHINNKFITWSGASSAVLTEWMDTSS